MMNSFPAAITIMFVQVFSNILDFKTTPKSVVYKESYSTSIKYEFSFFLIFLVYLKTTGQLQL